MADWLGAAAYPAEELRTEWRRFIWHQFHDDLTGTSIPRAYTFSWNDELIAQDKFAALSATASGGVSRALDTRVKGTPVVVYNPGRRNPPGDRRGGDRRGFRTARRVGLVAARRTGPGADSRL